MMNTLRTSAIFLLFATAVLSCNQGPMVELDFVRAQVNGVNFSATSAGWGIDSAQNTHEFSMTCQDSLGNELVFRCPAQTGVYGIVLTGGDATSTYIQASGVGDGTPYFGNSGAFEIQSLTTDRVQGIFLFDAINLDSEQEITISAGEFSLGVAN